MISYLLTRSYYLVSNRLLTNGQMVMTNLSEFFNKVQKSNKQMKTKICDLFEINQKLNQKFDLISISKPINNFRAGRFKNRKNSHKDNHEYLYLGIASAIKYNI